MPYMENSIHNTMEMYMNRAIIPIHQPLIIIDQYSQSINITNIWMKLNVS